MLRRIKSLDPSKDPHMHSARITFVDEDRLEKEWDGYSEGKKTGTHKFTLKRSRAL